VYRRSLSSSYDRSCDEQNNAATILKATSVGAEENDNIVLKIINNIDEQSNTTFHYIDRQVVASLLATYFTNLAILIELW
jgi:hypothetical protein